MRDIIECINSQCGASAGDCGCAAKVREAAAFLDRHAEDILNWPYMSPEVRKAAADCRAMAAKLRGGGEA